jgi:hypothetical protein
MDFFTRRIAHGMAETAGRQEVAPGTIPYSNLVFSKWDQIRVIVRIKAYAQVDLTQIAHARGSLPVFLGSTERRKE